MRRCRINLPNRCCRLISRVAHRAFEGGQAANRKGRAAMTRKTYCGNLLWQSSLTLLVPIGSSKTRMRKVNCILGVYIWRVTIGRSNDGGESNGEKSAVADKIISDLPSTIALIRIIDDRYETRTILNGETCCVSVKDGIVECALSDELYYGVKSGTTVQVISPPGNLKNKQHLVLAGNRRAAGESAFKDPFYVFADINYYGRNTIAIRNDGTLLLGSVITTEELMMDELSCGVNIEESDIIDAFRRRSLNGQLMKRGNK